MTTLTRSLSPATLYSPLLHHLCSTCFPPSLVDLPSPSTSPCSLNSTCHPFPESCTNHHRQPPQRPPPYRNPITCGSPELHHVWFFPRAPPPSTPPLVHSKSPVSLCTLLPTSPPPSFPFSVSHAVPLFGSEKGPCLSCSSRAHPPPESCSRSRIIHVDARAIPSIRAIESSRAMPVPPPRLCGPFYDCAECVLSMPTLKLHAPQS